MEEKSIHVCVTGSPCCTAGKKKLYWEITMKKKKRNWRNIANQLVFNKKIKKEVRIHETLRENKQQNLPVRKKKSHK